MADNQYIKIAEGIYWIGSKDGKNGILANPYLIIDGDEAIVLDGGSRPDFSDVMLKILQTGIKPHNISKLIYHHYDPDLCGSMPHFEEMIKREDLEIISHKYNNSFIKHYGTKSTLHCIDDLGRKLVMKSGRELLFIKTPYSHSPGSFMTWDIKTKTLFTSDIFGSYSSTKGLFSQVDQHCSNCSSYESCPVGKDCFMNGITAFHQLIMTSNKALKYALDQVDALPVERILPQHGNVIVGRENVQLVLNKLKQVSGIGIDGLQI
jgi:flavorubredoxin